MMKNERNGFVFHETYPDELTGQYQILECLNTAEGQETLLGVSREDNAKVVIKRYDTTHPLYQPDQLLNMSDLSCRGIPRFVGEFSTADAKYVVREYVEGESLAQYAGAHHFQEDEIIQIGLQLSEILSYLHNRMNPIVHRDIKPENIVIQRDGRVSLIDFGISREYKDNQRSDTVVVGTRHYAAPEQYGFRQTDNRSDIYSLGMVLAWMLYGDADVPDRPQGRLGKIIQKCTAFSPEDRYQSAEELGKELQKLTPEGIAKRRQRHKLTAVLVGIVLVPVIALNVKFHFDSMKKAVVFTEPLMEQAARLQLAKPEGALTREELEQVTQVYIIGDQIFPSEDEFYRGYDEFYSGEQIRGALSSLDDLKYIPNIKDLYIGAEQIKDITPIEGLDRLERVELFANDISDVSVLKDKHFLTDVRLADNPLKSIDFLAGCPYVSCLILNGAGSGYSGEVLEQFDYFHALDISCDTDCYKYLAGKSVQILKLGSYDLYDLECIRDMAQISELYIYKPQIQDISALAGREDITFVYMGEYPVKDLSPVFEMPNLEKVVVNPGQKAQIDAILRERTEPVGFEIEYLR